MTNKPSHTGKDGYIRIVVGQSAYKDANKRYNQEDYLFTRLAFIVSAEFANSERSLTTLTRVLEKILGQKRADEYMNNYDPQKLVTDLTNNKV